MPTNFTQHQRKALLAALRPGRQNSISAKALAQKIGCPLGGNQVKLRSLIKECIEIDGDLIGSATGKPAGFFIISTLQELEEYIDSLENRARSNNQRRSALISSWNRNPNTSKTKKNLLNIR